MYIPDKIILKNLVDEAKANTPSSKSYLDWVDRILKYVLQFDEFILTNINAAHIFRQIAKYVESLLIQFISEGSIDANNGFAIGQIVGEVLTQTSHVADFDVEDNSTELADILNIIPDTD